MSEQKIICQESHSPPTWSYSEPASSRLCCMANCSRSSSSSLMLSLCLPPSMVYPGGASNTHGGISPARHDTAAHGGGKVKGKRREGVLPNSVGDRTGLKEKNRRGKTEERLLSEKKRNPDKNKLHRSISPAFYGCQIFWTTRLCVFSQDYNSVDFCEIESRISTAVPSERSHNKSYLPSAWLQI